jgi:glutathione S-transferase
MILYGTYTSPYARHCRIALIESALEWQFVDTDYDASAIGSPTQKVPFLKDQECLLTDSTSILMHVRQQSNSPFIECIEEMEMYTLVNSATDTAINLFLLERDGITPDSSAYLARQKNRISTTLKVLEQLPLPTSDFSDCHIRLACFLDWAQFRERIALKPYVALSQFLSDINDWQPFAETSPRI